MNNNMYWAVDHVPLDVGTYRHYY